MNKAITWVVVAAVIILGGWFVLRDKAVSTETPSPNATTTSPGELPVVGTQATADDIVIDRPKLGDKVSSPLTVSGKARGSWYFEASAPVTVVDTRGKILGQGFVQAIGEWMTTEFVPFSGTISWSSTTTEGGAMIFMNDNPSGDPERSKYIAVPVFFE